MTVKIVNARPFILKLISVHNFVIYFSFSFSNEWFITLLFKKWQFRKLFKIFFHLFDIFIGNERIVNDTINLLLNVIYHKEQMG